jgi:amino acid transporter
MGLAERGYLPNWFKARSKYGTPTAGILTNTIVIIALGTADFGQLLELLNCTYIVSVLLEHAAFVKLRLYHKDCKFLCFLYLCISITSRGQFIIALLSSTTTVSYPNTRLGFDIACFSTVSRNYLHICNVELVGLCI